MKADVEPRPVVAGQTANGDALLSVQNVSLTFGGVKALRDVTWVKPELVAEIKFLEFTPDGLLRAPVFIALRSDKEPQQCVRESPVPEEAEAPVPENTAASLIKYLVRKLSLQSATTS